MRRNGLRVLPRPTDSGALPSQSSAKFGLPQFTCKLGTYDVNQAEAMNRFGVRGRAKWAQLVKEGMPRKPMGRGYSYDEAELAAWFAAREADEDGIPADYREMYAQERAKKTKAERELREIKLAEERGELVRADATRTKWSEEIVRARARLLRLPAELAAACFSAGSELEVEEILRGGVRAALEELSDG